MYLINRRQNGTQRKRYDLVVCGGGIPGVCAAVTAARAGVNVALLKTGQFLAATEAVCADAPHGAASFWHNRMAREGGISKRS